VDDKKNLSKKIRGSRDKPDVLMIDRRGRIKALVYIVKTFFKDFIQIWILNVSFVECRSRVLFVYLFQLHLL